MNKADKAPQGNNGVNRAMTDIGTIRAIIANQHFCNVHARDDRGTRAIMRLIVEPARDDPDLWMKVMIGICSNQPAALAWINWQASLDLAYVHARLEAYVDEGLGPIFRTAAYKPPMPPELKTNFNHVPDGKKTLACLFTVVLPPMWERRDYLRPRAGDTLWGYAGRLCECHGIGTFLAGQNVRYMKLAPPLREASDWDAFVVPGPGSERGLNRLYGRPLNQKWPLPLFTAAVEKFRARLNEGLAAAGIDPVDAQDAQNVLCESDKLFRAIEKGGKVSRKYKPSGEPVPA
jgi:hypothetical protein